ncbi:hypothetical protein LTR08_008679 [Meristemomyces frigidus]|nr:hypothetical protein LTR08_008679 [Meristemomyces frigidus]
MAANTIEAFREEMQQMQREHEIAMKQIHEQLLSLESTLLSFKTDMNTAETAQETAQSQISATLAKHKKWQCSLRDESYARGVSLPILSRPNIVIEKAELGENSESEAKGVEIPK